MYFSLKKKNNSIWVFCNVFDFNYLEAIQTAVFYKKTASKMLKRNLFMFLDIQVSSDQNKKGS